MEEQVILEFVGDAKGINEFFKGVEQGIDEELKAIAGVNKAFEKQETQVKKNTSTLDKFAKSVKGVTQGIAGGAVKQGTDQLEKFGTEVVKVTGESTKLVTQLRAMKQQLGTMDEGSAEFQKLAIEAAKLEDKIGDVRERIRVMASDTFAFDAMVDGVRGVTAAFTIAQSASALFGDENEELQKTLLKVQAATGLLVGVQEIANQVTGQGAAKLAITSAATRVYTFVTNGATVATKALRAALVTTGIGAIVVGIGLLIAYWDKLKSSISSAADASIKYNEAELSRIEFLIKRNELLGKSTDLLREKQLQAQLQVANAKKDEEGQVAALRELELLKIELTNRKAKEGFEDRKRAIESELELVGKNTARELKLKKDLIDIERSIRTAGEKLTQDELLGVLQAAEKKKQKLAEDFAKNRIETELNVDLKANIEFDPSADPVQEALDNFLKTKTSADALKLPIKGKIDIPDIELTEESKVALGDKIKDAFTDDSVKQSAIQATQEIFNAISQITDERRNARFEAELEDLDARKEAELNNKRLTDDQRAAIEEKYNRRAAKLKEEQFKANKKAAIAQALINGALAVTNIIATTPKLDFGAATIALLALNAVSTAASVATIAAQPIPKFKKGKVNIHGPGTETSDSIPAMLSKGESVINAQATRMYGPELELMNKFQLPDWEEMAAKASKNGGSKMADIDYDRLSSMIGKKVGDNIRPTSITVTDGHTVVEKGNDRRVYVDKYMRT